MTDTNLHDELAARTAHLSMHRPAETVLARGDRLRRRRHAAVVGASGGVAAVAIATALGVSTLAPQESGSPTPRPTAYAAWGPTMVNLDPDVADDVRRTCARDMDDMGLDITPQTQPVAADTRDGRTLVAYHVGAKYATCQLRAADEDTEGVPALLPAGTLVPVSGSQGRWALKPGTHLLSLDVTVAVHRPTGQVSDGAGSLRVSEAVDRVTIEAAGERFEAAVGGGFAMFWLPGELSAAEFDAVTATAYDASGGELASITLG